MIWVVMKLSRGSIMPDDYDLKEYWTLMPAGEKPWAIRIFTKGRFWEDKRTARGNPDPMAEDRHPSPVVSTATIEDKSPQRADSPVPLRQIH